MQHSPVAAVIGTGVTAEHEDVIGRNTIGLVVCPGRLFQAGQQVQVAAEQAVDIELVPRNSDFIARKSADLLRDDGITGDIGLKPVAVEGNIVPRFQGVNVDGLLVEQEQIVIVGRVFPLDQAN